MQSINLSAAELKNIIDKLHTIRFTCAPEKINEVFDNIQLRFME